MTQGQSRLVALVVSGIMLATSTAWGFSSAVGTAQQRRRLHKKAKTKSVAAPLPPAPTPPPPPPVPMHETAVPPVVTYEGGNLTIEAKNSTLSDVLQAVGKHTGATFDISSGDTTERVVGRIGPGPARDVLATLLNGSHFNYVMVSPLGKPSELSRVLLTPRSSVPASGYTAQQQPNPQFQQQPMAMSPMQPQAGAAEETAADADAGAEENNEAQDTSDAAQETAEQSSAQPGVPPPGVKTPEQLLQELRQQQQQVIQQQQQQGNQQGPKDNN